MDGFLGGHRRVVADKSEALAKSASLVIPFFLSNCLPVKSVGFVGFLFWDSALVVAVVIGMGYEIIENKNISTVGTGSGHDE